MAVSYVNTANTFQQWLIATQDLITVANNLTDNIAGTFYANTNPNISGATQLLDVSLLLSEILNHNPKIPFVYGDILKIQNNGIANK